MLNCILSCYDYLQYITVQILRAGGDSGTTFQWERNDCFHPESVTKSILPPRWVNIVEDTPVYTYFQVDRNSAAAVLDERMCS